MVAGPVSAPTSVVVPQNLLEPLSPLCGRYCKTSSETLVSSCKEPAGHEGSAPPNDGRITREYCSINSLYSSGRAEIASAFLARCSSISSGAFQFVAISKASADIPYRGARESRLEISAGQYFRATTPVASAPSPASRSLKKATLPLGPRSKTSRSESEVKTTPPWTRTYSAQ